MTITAIHGFMPCRRAIGEDVNKWAVVGAGLKNRLNKSTPNNIIIINNDMCYDVSTNINDNNNEETSHKLNSNDNNNKP